MQRWETRVRRWEHRAAERRSKRRLAAGCERANEGRQPSLANDNTDDAASAELLAAATPDIADNWGAEAISAPDMVAAR